VLDVIDLNVADRGRFTRRTCFLPRSSRSTVLAEIVAVSRQHRHCTSIDPLRKRGTSVRNAATSRCPQSRTAPEPRLGSLGRPPHDAPLGFWLRQLRRIGHAFGSVPCAPSTSASAPRLLLAGAPILLPHLLKVLLACVHVHSSQHTSDRRQWASMDSRLRLLSHFTQQVILRRHFK
jgi:hypothetical protein